MSHCGRAHYIAGWRSLPRSTPHHDHDERPHACIDGWVSMEVEVLDPDTGEEVLEEALYLCRRCADSR
jgi:hypothetical protein